MGSIHTGDQGLHHHDWSHRWSGGPADDAGQAAWQAALKAHLEAHRQGEDIVRTRALLASASRNGADRVTADTGASGRSATRNGV